MPIVFLGEPRRIIRYALLGAIAGLFITIPIMMWKFVVSGLVPKDEIVDTAMLLSVINAAIWLVGSYLFQKVVNRGLVITLDADGIERKTVWNRKRISWQDVSHFKLYRSKIMSRLHIFGKLNRGWFVRPLIMMPVIVDCEGISKALRERGVSERY